MAEQKDSWSSDAYQHSASFVPKLATKIVQWLDLQKDDVLLDVGCGVDDREDGILDLDFANLLAQGTGSVHGTDNSPAMVEASKQLCKDTTNATFQAFDATELVSQPELQKGTFTKAFSNAAMHWILRKESTRSTFFQGVYAALAPGGTFAFEMGGLGNVCEMRTALLMAVSRRVGMPAAMAADPWFFPEEIWITAQLEGAGFVVEKVEREWRPTTADKGGVEGWIRLMGSNLIDAVPESEREPVIKECADVLREVCKNPAGGEMMSLIHIHPPSVIIQLSIVNDAGQGAGPEANEGLGRHQSLDVAYSSPTSTDYTKVLDNAFHITTSRRVHWRHIPNSTTIIHLFFTLTPAADAKITIMKTLAGAEHDPLVFSYVHLAKYPRDQEALHTLKKIASIVKPIMRARKWKVGELAEFYPSETNLLGLNVNRGQKICIRLRYPGDRNQFLPFDAVLDTMLHELCHIVRGPHDSKFHALWEQLRDEHWSLLSKGYTGERFLSTGNRLGGTKVDSREARRLAREAAEKRRSQPTGTGPGQRLGGPAPRPGKDIRSVIADAADRRNKAAKGCANDRLNESQIQDIADTATRNGFRTQAEEDEANEAAIAQAMWDLVQEDEQAKYGSSYIQPTAENPTGNGGGAIVADAGGVGRAEPSHAYTSRNDGRAARTRDVARADQPRVWVWSGERRREDGDRELRVTSGAEDDVASVASFGKASVGARANLRDELERRHHLEKQFDPNSIRNWVGYPLPSGIRVRGCCGPVGGERNLIASGISLFATEPAPAPAPAQAAPTPATSRELPDDRGGMTSLMLDLKLERMLELPLLLLLLPGNLTPENVVDTTGYLRNKVVILGSDVWQIDVRGSLTSDPRIGRNLTLPESCLNSKARTVFAFASPFRQLQRSSFVKRTNTTKATTVQLNPVRSHRRTRRLQQRSYPRSALIQYILDCTYALHMYCRPPSNPRQLPFKSPLVGVHSVSAPAARRFRVSFPPFQIRRPYGPSNRHELAKPAPGSSAPGRIDTSSSSASSSFSGPPQTVSANLTVLLPRAIDSSPTPLSTICLDGPLLPAGSLSRWPPSCSLTTSCFFDNLEVPVRPGCIQNETKTNNLPTTTPRSFAHAMYSSAPPDIVFPW
ncbi:hypothetical protein G7046_g2302 [Stylonectria norvegica]|nr:hypothetical protein G7046_g2302 [Stylonectria norvegica]